MVDGKGGCLHHTSHCPTMLLDVFTVFAHDERHINPLVLTHGNIQRQHVSYTLQVIKGDNELLSAQRLQPLRVG